MGIYDRDYTRKDTGLPWEDEYRSAPRETRWSATAWLIIITVVVFLLQSLFVRRTPDGPLAVLDQWFALSGRTLLRGEVWRLVTYAFLHDRYSLFHILFNMLCLWWFGRPLESIYGSREFVLFYVSAAAFSGLVFCAVGMVTGTPAPVVGASGAVMATMMLFALHYPRQLIYIWGVIGVEARWLVAFLVVLNVLPLLNELQGGGVGDSTAYSAHVGGLLFGYLYRRGRWRLAPYWDRFAGFVTRWRRLRRGPKLRVHVPEFDEDPATIDRRVDELLDKIYQHGEASLTDEEREFLARASRRYRERRLR